MHGSPYIALDTSNITRFYKYLMLSTILSYLLDVLYNILIWQELKIWFSCREAGVTPKLLKRAAREGEEMNEKDEG